MKPSQPPPGRSLDLEVARELHARVVTELRTGWEARLGPSVFAQVLQLAFDYGTPLPQAAVAERLGCPLNTLKGWILRLRREYFQQFGLKVQRHTAPIEAKPELVYLLGLLTEFGFVGTVAATRPPDSR